MIAINILMSIFTILLLSIGIYLFYHRQKDFLIFHPTQNQLFSSVIKSFGIALVITGILSLLAIIIQNTIYICIVLTIGCIVVTAFYLCISKFISK